MDHLFSSSLLLDKKLQMFWLTPSSVLSFLVGCDVPEFWPNQTLLCLSYSQACRLKISLVLDKYVEIFVGPWRESQLIFFGIPYHASKMRCRWVGLITTHIDYFLMRYARTVLVFWNNINQHQLFTPQFWIDWSRLSESSKSIMLYSGLFHSGYWTLFMSVWFQ